MPRRVLTSEELAALQPHALAALMPPMTETAFGALVADLEQHGQRAPLVLFEGRILDGRHRARALRALNRGAVAVDYEGDQSPRDYVLSSNLQRRHLTTSQAAMVGARMVTTVHGRRADGEDVTQAGAAHAVGVSIRYVRDAQWLVEHDEELAERVFAGEITLAAAMRRARPPVEQEREESPPSIDPHPPMATPEPVVAGDAASIIAAVEVMRRVDPGVFAVELPDSVRRSVLLALEQFARIAYDVADEGGML
jgi:hypothetical protein